MLNKTILQLHQSLLKREFSCRELTQFYLDRAKRFNAELNCYITFTEEHALKTADAADKLFQQNQANVLSGIPIAHKDIFCTQDIKTTCGSKMLDNFISPYNATVVEKFNALMTPMLGKTNMDEFAMGSSNENSYYGLVKNPWDLHAVPGGSSGGSAAAIAAQLCLGATGTDTGGSIRQPAALCNITGLKPTYGRVSRYGMIAYASSLDQGGPMARSAEDVAILMQAMAGFDPKDSTSVAHPVPDYTQSLAHTLSGLTLGIPREYFGDGIDTDVANALSQAMEVYKKLGVTFKEVSLPHSHLSIPTYYIIAPAECSANLARFDGVRYGYRCENPKSLEDLYKRSRGEGFGEEVKRRIMTGTYVLSAGYYDAYYRKAQQVRRKISEDFKQALSTVDALISPTTPTPAFHIGEKCHDPVSMYLSDIFTIAVNLAGLPALSLPVGFSQQRPIGMQLIGNYFAEDKLLNIAHQFQLHTEWHLKTPAILGGNA